MNPDPGQQDLRLPFRPHWNSGGYLQHWNFQPRTAQRRAGTGKACGFVGRVGLLAVGLGIGTAVATGCIACAGADADSEGRGPAVGGAAATSNIETAHPGRRSSGSNAGIRTPVGLHSIESRTPDTAPLRPADRREEMRASTSLAASDHVIASAAIRITVPAAVMSQAEQAAEPVPAPLPFAAVSPPVPPPAVVISSAPELSEAVKPTFSNLLAALSDAMMDTTAVPADTALALSLGVARREIRSAVVVQGAASKAVSAAAATAGTPGVEAEWMTLSGSARSVSDRNASGGYAITLSGNGQASATMALPEEVGLTLRLRTAGGAPDMTLSIDGVPYTTLLVNTTSYSDYIFAGGISPGVHLITISSTTASTRNILYVDTLTTSSGPIVDEFLGKSGSAPSRLWTARSGSGFDNGSQTYSSSNAFLDGQGHLVIQATKGKKSSYTSGWVWTKNNLSFGYGTVVARVKMPAGQGLWPAVWLMGSDSDTIGWPASGEIDIAELPSTTTTVYSTLHGPIAGMANTQQAQVTSVMPDLSTDFHDYWVRHLPDAITFGVDAQTLGTLTPADLAPGATWVYNRPMYMILNLAVGGPWAGAPNSSTTFPAKMLVDSVTFAPA